MFITNELTACVMRWMFGLGQTVVSLPEKLDLTEFYYFDFFSWLV